MRSSKSLDDLINHDNLILFVSAFGFTDEVFCCYSFSGGVEVVVLKSYQK